MVVYFVVRAYARGALWWMWTVAAAYIAIIQLPAAVGVSFSEGRANAVSVALTCPAGCFCCICLCGCRRRSVWAKALRATAMVTAVFLFVVSIFFGTVGTLAVDLDVGDALATPLQSYEIPKLACDVTLWGGFGTDSGYAAVLYRRWNDAPWLRLRVREVKVDETVSEPEVSCADLDEGFKNLIRPLYSLPFPSQSRPDGEQR